MELMKQTASMTNHLYSRMTKGQPEPVVGMGATVLAWTDRHAGTITAVGSFRKLTLVTVKEDRATRTDANGMSECQSYDYAPDSEGREYRFAFDPKKGWREIVSSPKNGRLVFGDGYGLRIGSRDTYHDFSF